MPRTGKGGSRQGTPGTAYGNRTDLNSSMPVTVVKNQEYGRAAEQRAAQGAVPMGSTPVAQAAASPTQGAASTMLGQMAPTTQPTVKPGTSPFLQPTNRPEEPIQAGLPSGPGAGPEALGQPTQAISQSLSAMAAMPGASSAIMDLAASARLLGL